MTLLEKAAFLHSNKCESQRFRYYTMISFVEREWSWIIKINPLHSVGCFVPSLVNIWPSGFGKDENVKSFWEYQHHQRTWTTNKSETLLFIWANCGSGELKSSDCSSKCNTDELETIQSQRWIYIRVSKSEVTNSRLFWIPVIGMQWINVAL